MRGRRLVAPRGQGTRPTSDRVREALMSSLVDRLGTGLGGAVVLDLFAGSGALALEALSRGASRAVLVERDRPALWAIEQNVDALNLRQRVQIVAGDAQGAGISRARLAGPYGVIFCDPPYRIDQAKVAASLEGLGKSGAILPGAALAWEHSAGGSVPEPQGFAQERTYRYGDTAVTLLRYYGKDMVS